MSSSLFKCQLAQLPSPAAFGEGFAIITDQNNALYYCSGAAWTPTAGGGGGSVPQGERGAVFACIGDSQLATGTATGSYINSSVVGMAAQFTKQKIYFPITNNLAVGGTQLAAIYATLPAALALKPDFLVINGGTNDIGNNAVETAIATMYNIIRDTIAAGVVPIVIPITPRTSPSSWATYGYFIERFNRAIKELAYGRPDRVSAAGISSGKLPYVLDESKFWDYTSTTGNWNPGYISIDGLHWTYGTGVSFGAQIADIVNSLRPFALGSYTSTPYDVYDASNNPTGNLMNIGGVNRGMFQGTGGTLTSQSNPTLLLPTGSIATNWEAIRFNGSSTSTMVLSKENPRTDGLVTGERQRVQITSTTNGASQEQYQLKYRNGVQGINAGIAAGDTVIFEVAYQIMSCTRLLGCQLTLSESGPASPQAFTDGKLASNFVLGLSSSAFPDLLRLGVMRTAPMTLQSGINFLFPTIAINMMASDSATTNATFDGYFSDAKVFKVL